MIDNGKVYQKDTSDHGGWEAAFFSYDDGELFFETVICWTLVSERPYVENGKDEERYIEGQVLAEKGSDIGGVYDLPEDIGFLGYLNTKLPEKNRKEQMDHFKKQAEDLMGIRRSGHLPDNRI